VCSIQGTFKKNITPGFAGASFTTVYSLSGWWLGYSSHFIRFPQHNVSVVTLCNDDTRELREENRRSAGHWPDRRIATLAFN